MVQHLPASKEEIDAVQEQLHVPIPNVYREFLFRTNGAEFDMRVLYDAASIAEMYEALGFAQYAPEYISIGNDNGDYELVMEAREDAEYFGLLEQGSVGILKPEKLCSFKEWEKNGFSFDFWD